MEFKPFPKIERIGKLYMSITQKIHGTNAQIVITEYMGEHVVTVGSRNRWITPEDDNYGFAAYVKANEQEIIEKLGVGTHFGEWAGTGINSGEGLTEKTFVLFDYWKFPPERPLPKQMKVVPVLYKGELDFSMVEKTMNDLKDNGSRLVNGFMRPEGVVVQLGETRYKKVFDSEDTQWKKPDEAYQKVKNTSEEDALKLYGHLLQPIRLQKVLSKEEMLVVDFPNTLPTIVNNYFQDLLDEGEIKGTEVEVKGIRKALGSNIFKFVKDTVNGAGLR